MAANRNKRTRAPKHDARPSIPSWIWLLCAAAAGFAFAEIIPLVTHRNWHTNTAFIHKHSQSLPLSTTASPSRTSAPATPHFDFYKMLPRLHVAAPRKKKTIEPGKAPTVPENKRPTAPAGAYVLQVGSFRHYADADRLRAHLALLGVESNVQKVKTEGGQTWNRVRIGPIKNPKRLNKIRAQLRRKNIEPMVVRVDKGNH